MESHHRATDGDFENRAVAISAAGSSSPVKVAVTAQDQPANRVCAIGIVSICQGCEGIEDCQRASSRDLKDGTVAVGSPKFGYTVKVSITGWNQTGVGSRSVRRRTGEVVESSKRLSVCMERCPEKQTEA